jgi:hypothetical protein
MAFILVGLMQSKRVYRYIDVTKRRVVFHVFCVFAVGLVFFHVFFCFGVLAGKISGKLPLAIGGGRGRRKMRRSGRGRRMRRRLRKAC